MNKRVMLVLATLFIFIFTLPVLAAPIDAFADVPAKHWAYDAVRQLAKAGIVEGYGDGTFRGQNTITRYEMAIITANAMTKLSKADAQQKALIEKLAAEFSEELVKLGVRVAKLEAAQPGIKVGGQARLTYAYRSDSKPPSSQAGMGYDPKRNSYETYRFRLEGTAQFDDRLTFFGRLRAQDYDVSGGSQNMANAYGATPSGSFKDVYVEQFWVNWRKPFNWDNTSITAGRQGLLLGKGGIVYAVGDKDLFMFDYARQDFNWKIALKNNQVASVDPTVTTTNRELYLQAGFNNPNYHLTLFNVSGLDNNVIDPLKTNDKEMYAVAGDVKLGGGPVSFYGEYAKNTGQNTQNKIYWFGFTNGSPAYHPGLGFAASWTKTNANAQSLIYRHYEGNTQSIYESQLNALLGNGTLAGALWLNNTKGWELYDQRTLTKNVFLLTQIGQAKDIMTGQQLSNYFQSCLYMMF